MIHHPDRLPIAPAGGAIAVLAHLAAVRPGLLNDGERRFVASLSPGQEASLRRRCDHGMGGSDERLARSVTADWGQRQRHAPGREQQGERA
jgi:hypothetical protein